MPFASSTELLVLHAVRLKGMVNAAGVAQRFGLDRPEVEELLLDYEASGLVERVAFWDLTGWSVTEAGHREDGRRVAAELDEAAAREAVSQSHAAFTGLNTRFLETITRWQIRPMPGDSMASNDHTDWRWDGRVLDGLAGLGRRLRPIDEQLSGSLTRFTGYADRFAAALAQVDQGQRRYVDEPKIDSCHTVWFELHEDLLATLGLTRGTGA